jgi:hypothetical protein
MGNFRKSFKGELGKNTAKWLSNVIFGEGHSTPYRIITRNEDSKKEKEILKRNRELQNERLRNKVARDKERLLDEKNRLIEEQRELKDELKRRKLEEKEEKENQLREIIENNKSAVAESEEYIKTIQTFHTRSSEIFNWDELNIKPDFKKIIESKVSQIRFWETCENLESLKKKHYIVYNAFTSGGCNVLKCLSNFSLQIDISSNEVLVRNRKYDYNIFKSYLNDKNFILRFEEEFKSDIGSVKNYIEDLRSKIEELKLEREKLVDEKRNREKELNNTNWIAGVIGNKKNTLKEIINEIEIKIGKLSDEISNIEDLNNFTSLNKIYNEYNDYLETVKTIEAIWEKSRIEFKEQKELYHLANNINNSNNYIFFEIAEKIFSPYQFAQDLEIPIKSDYKSKIHILDLYAKGKDIVPNEELYMVRDKDLKSRPIAKKRFWEIYQDYISSVTLRMASEYFSFFSMRNEVIIKAYSEIFDESTGHESTELILAVKIIRKEFEKLNLQHVDPSSSLSTFECFYDFNLQRGFEKIYDKFNSETTLVESSVENNVLNNENNDSENYNNDSLSDRLNEDLFNQGISILVNEELYRFSYLQRKLQIDYDTMSEFEDLLKSSNLITQKQDSEFEYNVCLDCI